MKKEQKFSQAEAPNSDTKEAARMCSAESGNI
jgi:hypothetical protein